MTTLWTDAPDERARRRGQAGVTHGGPATTGPDWFGLMPGQRGLMPFGLGAFASPYCHPPHNGMAAPARGFG